MVDKETKQLIQQLEVQNRAAKMTATVNRSRENVHPYLFPDSDTSLSDFDVLERFRRRHICRTNQVPQPLLDAYKHRGTAWSSVQAIAKGYVAEKLAVTSPAVQIPPILLLRGEHDFVSKEYGLDAWLNVFPCGTNVKYKTLLGCSHHGLLENGSSYGSVLNAFFQDHDDDSVKENDSLRDGY